MVSFEIVEKIKTPLYIYILVVFIYLFLILGLPTIIFLIINIFIGPNSISVMLFFIFPMFVTSPVGYYVDNKILVRLKNIGNFNVFDDRLEINERTFYFHEIKKIGISFYIGGSKSSFVKKENHCVKFIIKTDGRFETYIIKQLATDDKTIKIDELFEKLKYKNGKFYRKIFIV